MKPIQLTKRLGIPAEVIEERGPTRKQIEKDEHLMSQLDPAPNYRPTEETTEEKRERKKAVKEERRVRPLTAKHFFFVFGIMKSMKLVILLSFCFIKKLLF